MDAEALDVAPHSFDVALSSFVLHLLPRPDVGVAQVRRALRRGVDASLRRRPPPPVVLGLG